MQSFKEYTTEHLDENVQLNEVNDSQIVKGLSLSPVPENNSGGMPLGRLTFSFKESKHAYYIFNKDGWFRKETDPAKGYGVMFRSMTRLGKPRSSMAGSRIIIQNVKFIYLPAHIDFDDRKEYDTGTGELYIDQDSFYQDALFIDKKNMLLDVPALVKWIDKQAKSKIWSP